MPTYRADELTQQLHDWILRNKMWYTLQLVTSPGIIIIWGIFMCTDREHLVAWLIDFLSQMCACPAKV